MPFPKKIHGKHMFQKQCNPNGDLSTQEDYFSLIEDGYFNSYKHLSENNRMEYDNCFLKINLKQDCNNKILEILVSDFPFKLAELIVYKALN